MKELKFEYKDGVIFTNPDNMFGYNDISECEGYLRMCFDNLKRMKIKEKCHGTNFFLKLSIGPFITYQSLMDILDYIDLNFNDFKKYMLSEETRIPRAHFERAWFFDLIRSNKK